MVDATVRAGTVGRRLAWISARTQLGWASAVADVVGLLGAYLIAMVLAPAVVPGTGQPIPLWPVALLAVDMLAVFYVMGLHELEVYISRPLHLWTLLRAGLLAMALPALTLLIVPAEATVEFRLAFLMTFALFIVFTGVLRFVLIDGLCSIWLRHRKPVSLLVGESEAVGALATRLANLRGFQRVERVSSATLRQDAETAISDVLERGIPMGSMIAAVFIDASTMSPREAFKATSAAQALGTEVYVLSPLLEGLETNRLLRNLFGAPAVRVRKSLQDAGPYALKRAFDVAGSSVLLLLAAPVIAALGAAVRMSSPGPVFYRQTRVGQGGTPFEFVKLRSMVVDGDEGIHEEYVKSFMNGTADTVAATNGDAVFKKLDDPRITPVGRFIRKYSLDEIPQFYNVFRGDMSLVGPRPPLPYEVREYDEWDVLRLTVPSGITGLWQVEGRSRVSFDEMILQDLMYAQNMRLLVDIGLCLRTLPAALLGGGGG